MIITDKKIFEFIGTLWTELNSSTTPNGRKIHGAGFKFKHNGENGWIPAYHLFENNELYGMHKDAIEKLLVHYGATDICYESGMTEII